MNLKEPFKNEKIIKRPKNGEWIIFQYSPFASSVITDNKKILFVSRNENEAETAFILLKVWQEIIQS